MAKITGALIAIGIALFVFLEITWAVFKYFTSEYITWVVVLSVILMLAALVISTPLQIDSLKDDYNTDNLKFENAQAFYERANNRVLADSRGSIRQANGTVHDSKSFEEAKREVYSIALP